MIVPVLIGVGAAGALYKILSKKTVVATDPSLQPNIDAAIATQAATDAKLTSLGYNTTAAVRTDAVPPPPAPAVAAKLQDAGFDVPGASILGSGNSIATDQTLMSPNGNFTLWLQADGNLVLYKSPGRRPKAQLSKNDILWQTNTVGTVKLTMTTGGNLVLFNAAGVPKWGSNTPNNPGAVFVVNDDGTLYIVASDTVVWKTGVTTIATAYSSTATVTPEMTSKQKTMAREQQVYDAQHNPIKPPSADFVYMAVTGDKPGKIMERFGITDASILAILNYGGTVMKNFLGTGLDIEVFNLNNHINQPRGIILPAYAKDLGSRVGATGNVWDRDGE